MTAAAPSAEQWCRVCDNHGTTIDYGDVSPCNHCDAGLARKLAATIGCGVLPDAMASAIIRTVRKHDGDRGEA